MREWHILAVICFSATLWLFLFPLGLVMAFDVDCVRDCTQSQIEEIFWVVVVCLAALGLQVLAIATLRKKRRHKDVP